MKTPDPECTTPDPTMPDYPRLPPSGINVIVVGAGFAGISAAIECDRKGHSVTLVEKVENIDEITRIGDIISFDPNGASWMSEHDLFHG